MRNERNIELNSRNLKFLYPHLDLDFSGYEIMVVCSLDQRIELFRKEM